MTKPVITKRSVKGAALTYNELDANFQNLKDATLTLTAGSGGTSVTADLNGTITLVAGTNVTLTGNDTAKTITINSTSSGSVNSGTEGQFAFYAANGDTLSGQTYLTHDDYDNVVKLNSAGLNINGNLILDNSSAYDMQISGSFIKFPELTTTERNAFGAANGMTIYNTTTNKLQTYVNGSWVDLH